MYVLVRGGSWDSLASPSISVMTLGIEVYGHRPYTSGVRVKEGCTYVYQE
jgi:hypothetical protein